MGWFKQETNGELTIGPNLLMIFPDGQVPAKDDADWKGSDGNPLYYKQRDNKLYVELSMRVSWKFLNLNVAFRYVMKEPTRSLHIYSDVGGSTVVGNKMTDLLREIKYHREGRGSVYFEPYTFIIYLFATK